MTLLIHPRDLIDRLNAVSRRATWTVLAASWLAFVTFDGLAPEVGTGPLYIPLIALATRAAGSARSVRGHLRINPDAAFGHFVLAQRLGEFLHRYPDLSVEVMVRARMGDLVAEGFDVAVRFGEPEPSALIAWLLLRTRVLTCATPDYVARHGRPEHPSDLDGGEHTCIQFRDPATGRPFA